MTTEDDITRYLVFLTRNHSSPIGIYFEIKNTNVESMCFYSCVQNTSVRSPRLSWLRVLIDF